LRAAPLAVVGETSASVDCLVVGAGAAGLSAAWRLRGAGIESLLVFEVDGVEGGTAQSGKNDVSAYPWGAHYLPAPLTTSGPVPRLLNELGVVTGVDETGAPQFAEEVLIHEPEERLFYKGHWYEGRTCERGRVTTTSRSSRSSRRSRIRSLERVTRRGARRSRCPSRPAATTRNGPRSTASRWRSGSPSRASPRPGSSGWPITRAAMTTARCRSRSARGRGLWYFCASAPRSPRARLFETAGVRVPCLSRTPLPRAHAPPQRSLGF